MERRKADLYLCLVAAALPASDELEALIAAVRPAAMLLTGVEKSASLKPLRDLIQSAKRQNLAVLVADDIDLAADLGADGVHIGADQRRLAEARSRLGADRTVGVSCRLSRHEAMVMGEGGADYIAFGEHWGAGPHDPQALAEMVAWWAALFEVPCVAWLGTDDPVGEARRLISAGADYIGVRWAAGGVSDFERLSGIAAGLRG
jgi:thiamine-phosphate pyrophosphorylase